MLVLAFIPLMLVAAAGTWRRAQGADADEATDCPALSWTRTLVAGSVLGLLTGFFGVGEAS